MHVEGNSKDDLQVTSNTKGSVIHAKKSAAFRFQKLKGDNLRNGFNDVDVIII